MTTTDERARANPLLRVQMMELLDELSQMLTDHAFSLARAEQGRNAKPKEEDDAKDRLVWQLAEFLTQGQWPRDADSPLLKGYQVSEFYASDWFQTGQTFMTTKRWTANNEPIP